MRNRIAMAVMAVIMIGGVKGAKANVLAINEMKQELTVLTQRHAEAKVNLKRAKMETKSLRIAYKTLSKSIKLAVKSDTNNKKAEQASIESVGYGSKRNPYLADMAHVVGQANLVRSEY
jgi:ribosomal protein L24